MLPGHLYLTFAIRLSARAGRVERAAALATLPQNTVKLSDIWHEAVETFGAHSGAVLAVALIGFAGISTAAQLFSQLAGEAQGFSAVVVCLAALGLVLQSLTQGAVAWVGLHGETSTALLVSALRAALGRWRLLLPGTLLYAASTFVCAVGFALATGSGLVVNTVNSQPGNLLRIVASHGIDVATLGPLHPLAELATPARHTLMQLTLQPDGAGLDGADLARRFETYIPGARPADLQLAYRMVRTLNVYAVWADAAPRNVLIALACLLLLVGTEVLLRFRVAAAMCMGPRCGLFAPLSESARLSLSSLRLVLASTWALRLAVGAAQIIFIVLPLMVADNVVLPQVSSIAGAPWVRFTCRVACCAGSAMVSAVLAAFCHLYDARLFVALSRQ
jgi:hypothetical protein